jgi:DNA topoisomerase-3
MKVYLAEKPSVAREIARILGATRKENGYLLGNGIAVTWAFGHLVGEMMPADYDAEWGKWTFESLPLIPETFGLKKVGDEGASRQFDVVADLLGQASVVVCATDAGREGELIFRNIYDLSGSTAPIERLWCSSLTDEALTKALDDLQPGAKFDNLASAARCRSQADWLVGLNATRAYTTFMNSRGALSVGRVQTPVLKLIVDRRRAIDSFQSSPFWEGQAVYRETVFKSDLERFADHGKAAAWLASLGDAPFEVVSVETKEKREKSPLLFDLTELQREMNRRHKWSAGETLEELQALYEAKVVTYPRTDSRHLSDDMLSEVENVAGKLVADLLQLEALEISKSHRAFNNTKVSDHHAVIPTSVIPGKLSERGRILYDAVAVRFIACFSPDCVKDVTKVKGKVLEELFSASGVVLKALGWRGVEQPPSDKETVLPAFEKGESGACVVSLKEGKTTPPKEYNEASLLTAMESAGKTLDDEEILDAMKEKGLGTPATRAAIIEGLLKRNFIERNKGNILAAPTGIALVDAVGDSTVSSVELTGEWEFQLRRIERGEVSGSEFIESTKKYVRELIGEVAGTSAEKIAAVKSAADSDKIGDCPMCGKAVFEFPKLYTCRDKECDFAIWKKIAGKSVPITAAKSILSKGRSSLIKSFKSKADKPFSAFLVWDKEKKKVGFEFEKN